jgi:excisionase family DNA binding protein
MEPVTRQLDLWASRSDSPPRVKAPTSSELPDGLRLEFLADPTRCLTAAEAAAHLGIGRTTVYRLMGDGVLTSIKIGRCRRIPIASIAAYVNERLTQGAPT